MPAMAGAPPSSPVDETITGSITWDENTTMSGFVLIKNGAQLTIDHAEIKVNETLLIAVKPGGTLRMINASISASEWQPMLTSWGTSGTVEVPTENAGSVALARIYAGDGTNLTGWNATWDGSSTTHELDGTTDDVAIPSNIGNETSLVISRNTSSTSTQIKISSIRVIRGTSDSNISAGLLPHSGGFMVEGERPIEINVEGDLTLTNSSIHGVKLQIMGGHATAVNSSATASSPLDVQLGGILDWQSGSIQGCTSYGRGYLADAILSGKASSANFGSSVTLSGSSSADVCDRWIRLINDQTLQTPYPNAEISVSGLGISRQTQWGTTGSDGSWTLERTSVFGHDIVAIGRANGDLEWMNATFNLSWDGAWQDVELVNQIIGLNETHYISANSPNPKVTSIQLNTTSSETSGTVLAEIEIQNLGSASVNTSISCTSNGDEADITPRSPRVELDQSQKTNVSVIWRSAEGGIKTLTCAPDPGTGSLPAGSEGITISATSGELLWIKSESKGANTGIAFVIGMGIVIASALAVLLRRKSFLDSNKLDTFHGEE